MIAEAQVPEFYDGGYWYVVAVVVTDDGTALPDFVGSSICAQYGAVNGNLYAAVRTAVFRFFPPADVSLSDVIASAASEGSLPASTKFFARIRSQ